MPCLYFLIFIIQLLRYLLLSSESCLILKLPAFLSLKAAVTISFINLWEYTLLFTY